MKKIYLAGGCFWGVQHFIRQIKGVVSTTVGYANSIKPNPSYEEVKSNTTNAAETVEVTYNESEISLEEILKLYFKIIDPESIDKQGEDIGHQYRTGIYYTDELDLNIINKEIDIIKNHYKTIHTEVLKLDNFYKAEEYHQDYLLKNPQGYCHITPELINLAKKYSK